MKKILLIISLNLLVANSSLFSQKISNEKKIQIEHLVSQLDTSKFKNNVLYDLVYPLANLKNFNQNNRKDTSNYKHFSQSIFELRLASRNTFKLNNGIIEAIKNYSEKNNICSIGILNIDFTTIKDDAFDQNNPKISIDSTSNYKKLVELPNKNPYQHKHTIIISPLVNELVLTNQPIKFDFDKLFYDMSYNAINNLNITFEDNQTINIINNGNFINKVAFHNFQNSGIKTLKFTGNFNNGQTFETYATLSLKDISQNRQPQLYYEESIVKQIRADEIFQPYVPEPDTPYTHTINANNKSAMNFKVFYGVNKHKLTKPIIVIDGIDYDYYNGIYNNSYYNYDISYIASLVDNSNNNLFMTQLRNLGFDIVIGDFPDYSIGDLVYVHNFNLTTGGYQLDTIPGGKIRKGGADYIQRNAKVLKKLIKVVNDSLSANNSNEQSVLIGPSMGGLVSRWALKELEDEGYNHNVRLWVSFDAPHQGANMPTAFQYASDYSNDFDALDKLNRNASKEMLKYHLQNEHNDIISGGAPNFRQRFDTELNNLGYPQNLRKIAVSKGSFMGSEINNPRDKILDTNIWMTYPIQSDIFSGRLFFSNNSGTTQTIHFDYNDTIEWLTSFSDCFKYVQTNSSYGSYDNAPGSYIEFDPDLINFDIDDIRGQIPNWIHIDGYLDIYKTKFSFIPTKSSLDFQGNNKLLRENLCSHYGNLLQQNLTPFDSYFAPLDNEPHEDVKLLTPANSSWILQEILGNSPSPYPDSNLCSIPITLSGPGHLCPNEQATYQINTNQPVDWILDGLTERNRTNNSITVTKDSQIGLAILTAIVDNTAYKKYIICTPIIDLIHHGNEITLRTSNDNVPLDQQGITDVTWQLTHGSGTILSADNRQADIDSNDYYGEVTVTNEGGSVTKTFFGPNPDKCYIIKKAGTDKYQVIDRCNGYVTITSMPIKEIYNEFGNKIQDAPVINDKIDVSTSGNTGDIRIVRVVVNGENVSKIIVKE